MTRRHSLFHTHAAEYPILLLIVSSHAYFLPYLLVQGIVSFSALCEAARGSYTGLRGLRWASSWAILIPRLRRSGASATTLIRLQTLGTVLIRSAATFVR